VRIRTTTRPGASPRLISITTATNSSVRSDHAGAPLPPAKVSVTGLLPGRAAVLISGGLAATSGGPGADLAPSAARTIPFAVLRHASTEGEVSA
jgi:hypothetical protein